MKNLSNSFLLIFLLNNGMILSYHNKNLIIFTNFDAFAFGKSVFRYTAFKLVYNFVVVDKTETPFRCGSVLEPHFLFLWT